MISTFDPDFGAIVVLAELTGATGSARLDLLLDTGANTTVISAGSLATVGMDTSNPPGRIPVTTASSTESAGLFIVPKLEALGVARTNHPILCHALPEDVPFDGLLRLDFFDGHVLTLDFINHTVTLH